VSNVVVPDMVGAAVGWRVWEVRMLRLNSVTYGGGEPWPAGAPLRAACSKTHAFMWVKIDEPDTDLRACHLEVLLRVGKDGASCPASAYESEGKKLRRENPRVDYRLLPHESVPCANHTCGIYAVSEPEHLSSYPNYNRAVGTVSLWGKVVPGDKGYRAEFAYPKEVWIPCSPSEEKERTLVAAGLVDLYGIPVHVGLTDELDERLRARGAYQSSLEPHRLTAS
jgi:hypothetical protein